MKMTLRMVTLAAALISVPAIASANNNPQANGRRLCGGKDAGKGQCGNAK